MVICFQNAASTYPTFLSERFDFDRTILLSDRRMETYAVSYSLNWNSRNLPGVSWMTEIVVCWVTLFFIPSDPLVNNSLFCRQVKLPLRFMPCCPFYLKHLWRFLSLSFPPEFGKLVFPRLITMDFKFLAITLMVVQCVAALRFVAYVDE